MTKLFKRGVGVPRFVLCLIVRRGVGVPRVAVRGVGAPLLVFAGCRGAPF